MNKARPIKFLLIALLALLSFNKGYASHLGAADIWATYIGDAQHPLRYVVRLNVYRACEPSQSLLSAPFSVMMISNGSCVVPPQSPVVTPDTVMLTMDTIVGNGSDTLDQLCSAFKSLNSCRQPSSIYPGFNRFNFIDTVDLPYRCSDWTFIWDQGARNAGIKNLCQPASSYDIFIDAHLNDLFSDESSPQFTIDPIPYVCVNEPAQFFNGPFDPNGDSLVVENQQPRGCWFGSPCAPGCGPLAEIPYDVTIPGGGVSYSLGNPIQSLVAPYLVDNLTGIATFTPAFIGKYVIAFKVSKYDHITKALLGSTRRDVQVSVLQCVAPPPNIDTIPHSITGGILDTTGGANVLYVCPGAVVSFDMTARANTGGTAVYLSVDTSNSNTPGNVFNVPVNNAPIVTGTYTWVPGDTSIGVHTVIFSSIDSSCTIQQPVVQKSFLVVTIKVIQGINALPKVYRHCVLSQTPVTLNVIGLPTNFQYNWTDLSGNTTGITNSNTANPTVAPLDTTKYIVTAGGLPASCKSIDTVVVDVDPTNSMTITPVSPIVLCKEGTVVLTAHPVGNKPNEDLPCGVPLVPTNTSTPDSTIVTPSSGMYGGSTNSSSSCSPLVGNLSSHHQYLIRASDMLNSGMVSGALTALSFSVNKVFTTTTYSNVTISLACTTVDSLNTDGSFLAGGTPVFSSATPVSVSLPGFVTFPFNTVYNWDTAQNLLVDICYSNTNSTPVPPVFDFYTTNYRSSTFAYSDAGDVCSGFTATPGGYPQYTLPIFRFNYYDAPIVNFGYQWQKIYGSNFVSDSSAQSPKIYIDQSSRYYVISRGKSGCAFMDSIDIYLDPPRHPSITPFDTTVCAGVAINLNASFAYNGYLWYQNGLDQASSLSCSTCQVPTAKLDTTTFYTTVFSDSVHCADTAHASITVIPYPKITLNTHDTTVKYGKSVMLIASPQEDADAMNYKYVWTPAFSLDDQYMYNPTATPLAPTVYSVIVYNQFCPVYDTVKVNIDYRSNIMVPSAFTPNNDGKNDVFRVANLTFQRVIEFRVFNRWGQQVYSALDNSGWDGTWNGTSLDMGVYNYIIRVVYPDGVEDTFNGNVTLIR